MTLEILKLEILLTNEDLNFIRDSVHFLYTGDCY